MITHAPQLLTSGRIAEILGTGPERVSRVLRTRRHIQPAAYAGHVRLFNNAALAMVRHEINTIDARRHTNTDEETIDGE